MQVDTSQTMLIALNESDRQTLDEVVVVGYGTQKKRTVTGAISTVSIEDLKKAPGILQNPIHYDLILCCLGLRAQLLQKVRCNERVHRRSLR